MINTFGEILKNIRLERGIGQTQLAKSINVSKGTISLWENNLREPKLSNLISLSKFFNVSLDYLAGMSEY